jgi:RNA polymerase sigma factor (sigma-70 family)
VAHNLALNSIRAGSHEGESTTEDEERFDIALAAEQLTPEQLLIEKEKMDWLHSAIQGLSGQQRQAICMRAESLLYREIEAVLGVSEDTVAEHLQRAMQKLMRQAHEQ